MSLSKQKRNLNSDDSLYFYRLCFKTYYAHKYHQYCIRDTLYHTALLVASFSHHFTFNTDYNYKNCCMGKKPNHAFQFNMYTNTSTKKVIDFGHNTHVMIDSMWKNSRDALSSVLYVLRR